MLNSHNDKILKKILNDISLENFSNQVILSFKDSHTSDYVVSQIAHGFFCETFQNNSDCKCDIYRKITNNTFTNILALGDFNSAIKKEGIISSVKFLNMSSMLKTNKKLFVIKGPENLTLSAANSLLKFLEEPNINTHIILVSLRESKILETITSRCIKFLFLKNENNNNSVDDEILNFLNNINTKKFINNYKIINNLKNKDKNEILLFIQKTIDATNYFWIKNLLLKIQADILRNCNKNLCLYNLLFQLEKELNL